MSAHLDKKLHCNIDHLVSKSGMLHCWGWVCDESGPLIDLRIQCRLLDGNQIEQSIQYGLPRGDVKSQLKEFPHAEASGFLVNIAWRNSELIDADLIAKTVTGETKRIPLINTRYAPPRDRLPNSSSSRMAMTLARRAFRLVWQGNFRTLTEKLNRYLAHKPTRVLDPLAEIKKALGGQDLNEPALLVIDHDLGGGAPQYRKQLIDSHVAAGGVALLLTFHLPTLAYAVQVYGTKDDRRFAVPDLVEVRELAQQGYIKDIFFNNAVSFPQPEAIPEFLLRLRSITGGQLTLAVHDFYMACPSHFLINAYGKFCNIPEIGVCATCLAKNQEGFVSFFPSRDIKLWRREWHALINAADKILFFSQSTLHLLIKAYPDLSGNKLHITPHSMEYFSAERIPIAMDGPIHIGIVGNIGRHKGARVIAGLADSIRDHLSSEKITIFGLIDESVPKDIVEIKGNYKHSDLPTLMKSSGINLVFVPSVVPETFSYVTHEIIQMGLPLVCFDLGAQAEAVNRYPMGIVIPYLEGDQLLNALRVAFVSLQSRVKSLEAGD